MNMALVSLAESGKIQQKLRFLHIQMQITQSVWNLGVSDCDVK